MRWIFKFLFSVVTYSDILDASVRIAPYIHTTPVLTCRSINEMAGCSLYFKCENFQKIGAFKIRGGMNATLLLSAEARSKGVATHSSGNHAQAIAYAARTLGVPAYIVMPDQSPRVKVEAVRGYGGQVTFCASTQAARESTLQQIVDATGAAFIHPYDNDYVIAGQGTAAREMIEQVSVKLDAVVAPVGGGGLMSGTSLSTRALLPGARIYAAEPEGAADAFLSMQAGRVVPADYVDTIADGLRTTLSQRTFDILQAHIEQVLPVSEAEIKAALRLVYERMKIVAEPSCVVPLAAVLRNRPLFAGQNVGIILTGGNVDLSEMASLFQAGA